MKPKSEVFNVDCLDYMRGLPDNTFELAIADPPYGDAGSGTLGGGKRFGERFDRYKQITPPKKRTHFVFGARENSRTYQDRRNMGIEIRKKIVGWDEAPRQEFFDELFRVSRRQIIWGGNYFSLPPTRCFLVWKKLTISESFSMAMAEYAWTSFADNAKVFECVPQGDRKDVRFHPTQKPVDLYAWTLRLFAQPGFTIFDPMMGSQSSRIAAYKMGFDYVGCELDKEYFDKGCERFERECLGVIKTKDGRTIKEQTLFDF